MPCDPSLISVEATVREGHASEGSAAISGSHNGMCYLQLTFLMSGANTRDAAHEVLEQMKLTWGVRGAGATQRMRLASECE
jgi:hypothetical protein